MSASMIQSKMVEYQNEVKEKSPITKKYVYDQWKSKMHLKRICYDVRVKSYQRKIIDPIKYCLTIVNQIHVVILSDSITDG